MLNGLVILTFAGYITSYDGYSSKAHTVPKTVMNGYSTNKWENISSRRRKQWHCQWWKEKKILGKWMLVNQSGNSVFVQHNGSVVCKHLLSFFLSLDLVALVSDDCCELPFRKSACKTLLATVSCFCSVHSKWCQRSRLFQSSFIRSQLSGHQDST